MMQKNWHLSSDDSEVDTWETKALGAEVLSLLKPLSLALVFCVSDHSHLSDVGIVACTVVSLLVFLTWQAVGTNERKYSDHSHAGAETSPKPRM